MKENGHRVNVMWRKSIVKSITFNLSINTTTYMQEDYFEI